MEIDPTTRIILSTQRYKSAPRTDQFINIPFNQSTKDCICRRTNRKSRSTNECWSFGRFEKNQWKRKNSYYGHSWLCCDYEIPGQNTEMRRQYYFWSGSKNGLSRFFSDKNLAKSNITKGKVTRWNLSPCPQEIPDKIIIYKIKKATKSLDIKCRNFTKCENLEKSWHLRIIAIYISVFA